MVVAKKVSVYKDFNKRQHLIIPFAISKFNQKALKFEEIKSIFLNFRSMNNINRKKTKFLTHFIVTGLFLYSLKASENSRISDAFRGYRKRAVA